MKTGTPPRIKRSSIDFPKFQKQETDTNPIPFSFLNEKILLPQLSSFIGYTNEKSHAIVRENLKASGLYDGPIKGIPARYCPSFEEKIVRFPDRSRHQVILEPEGLDTDEIYVGGLGNSLPLDIQLRFIRSVEGLEAAEIMRPGYAIEYDYINPLELNPSLETKRIKGLFFAGQINGTSGYEEAAAQGLWAGINAACKIQGRPPFILDRSEAYIGVMIDDLVTKGTQEPYRMFTSRAEYRLMLREDNADLRLVEKGYGLGLVSKDQVFETRERKKQIKAEIRRIKNTVIKPIQSVNDYLSQKGTQPITDGVFLDQLLKRTELDYGLVQAIASPDVELDKKVFDQVEIEIKYEGYIQKQLKEIEKFKNLEKITIPEGFDYNGVHGLSEELKAKLSSINPKSLGQASRMDGMTPAALSVLMIALKARDKSHPKSEAGPVDANEGPGNRPASR